MKIDESIEENTLFWKKLGSSVNLSPRCRFKHASCVYGNHVYMFGGKDASQPLKDLWKLNINNEEWEELDTHGSELGHLQGHSMVSHKCLILIFGGEFTDSSRTAPLWIYNPDLNHIRKWWCEKHAVQPSGRREHSAVIYDNSMYIYGGFSDIKGPTSELWEYSIDEEEWFLLPSPSGNFPGNRHGHSAVVKGNFMYVYGGMKDLTVKNDLWLYKFKTNKWSPIKSQNGPPALSGHTATIVCDVMIICGGETQGILSNDVWSYHFETNTWSRLEHDNRASLPPLTQHSVVVIQNGGSRDKEATTRTSSLPYIQRKKQRASQHSLPGRPKSTPPNASSMNFQNRIFPSTSNACDEADTSFMRTVSVDSQHDGQPDDKPLLTTRSAGDGFGVYNHGLDTSLENSECKSNLVCLQKLTENDCYELCSECLKKHSITKPKVVHAMSTNSICKLCARPLRHSRHESDLFLEDLDIEDSNSGSLNDIPNSFYLMNNEQAKIPNSSSEVETIELKSIAENSGTRSCDSDVILSCAKCDHTHVCNNGSRQGAPHIPTNYKEFTSIATQTEGTLERRVGTSGQSFLKTNRSELYREQQTTSFSTQNVELQELNNTKSNCCQILMIGGKTNNRESLASPLSLWKLEIPLR